MTQEQQRSYQSISTPSATAQIGKRKRRWWLRVSLGVAGLVIVVTVSSLFFGSFGPLTNPVKFFLEEVLLEELLGISDFFYFIYPYSLGLITVISALFYAFIAGIIVWGIELRKVAKSVTILFAIAVILGFMWMQGFQLVFFDFQCVATPSHRSDSSIFSLTRTCSIEYSDFSIPPSLYNSTEPQTLNMFNGMVISHEEFERIKSHNGNMRYFCSSDCEPVNYQCRSSVNSTCRTCTDTCLKNYRESRERIGHIVDLLKSESFQRCINLCRP